MPSSIESKSNTSTVDLNIIENVSNYKKHELPNLEVKKIKITSVNPITHQLSIAKNGIVKKIKANDISVHLDFDFLLAPSLKQGSGELTGIKKEVYNIICEIYGIPKSKWPRRYPKQKQFYSEDICKNNKIFELLNDFLLNYAELYDKTMPIYDKRTFFLKDLGKQTYFLDENNKSISSTSKIELYSRYLISKLFPELKEIQMSDDNFYVHTFPDEAIIGVHPVKSNEINTTFYDYRKTSHGKSIITQPYTKKCNAVSAAAIRLNDLDYFVNISDRNTIIKTMSDISKYIECTGFLSEKTKNTSLEELRRSILHYGPAIVTIRSSNLKNAKVVVDKIRSDHITIRDPYHGWMIDIKPEYFSFEPVCIHIIKNSKIIG